MGMPYVAKAMYLYYSGWTAIFHWSTQYMFHGNSVLKGKQCSSMGKSGNVSEPQRYSEERDHNHDKLIKPDRTSDDAAEGSSPRDRRLVSGNRSVRIGS